VNPVFFTGHSLSGLEEVEAVKTMGCEMLVFKRTLHMKIRNFFNLRIGFRACVESSEGHQKWGVYLIKTIKKSFESLIAAVKSFEF